MKRLLITGASGMLGGEIFARATSEWNAVGACHRTAHDGLLQLNFARPDELEQKITEQSFTHIIHCAAIRDPDVCLKHPEEAALVNVQGSRRIAQAAQTLGATLCYISTDYVFDGTRPPYKETDFPSPINVYGRSKYAGEQAAQTVDEHLVIRIPALYRSVLGDRANIITKFAEQLAAGKTLHLDSQTVRYYTRVEDVADAVLFLLESNVRGRVHVSSGEKTSKAAFGRQVATQLGYSPERVQDAPPPTSGDARPDNSQLDTTRYRSLGGPHLQSPSEAIPRDLSGLSE